MTFNGFQQGATLYTQSFGSRPEDVEIPHLDSRAPAVSDTRYPLGKRWVDVVAGNAYVLVKFTSVGGILQANWAQTGGIGGFTLSSGSLTISNGTLNLGTAGNKINIATGTNASVGTSAAMTAGAVTVATTASSATALIFYSRKTTGGTPGDVSITAQDGTGFTLTSTSNTETSTFNWWIINA